MTQEGALQFVWTDDLARLLIEEDGAGAEQLRTWLGSPVGYPLPDELSPLQFARALFATEQDILDRAS